MAVVPGIISLIRAAIAVPIPNNDASAPRTNVTGSTSRPDSSDQHAIRTRSAARRAPVADSASTSVLRIDRC